MSESTLTSKRKYATQSLLAAIAIGIGVWGVSLSFDTGVQAQTPGTPGEGAEGGQALDPAVYSHVLKLRKQAGLTTEDLAAMSMSPADSGAVLNRLADWSQTNHSRLDDADRAVYAAERELRELRRKIRTGQATPQEANSLGEKARAVTQAKQARRTLQLEGGGVAMQASPNPGQREAWQQASGLVGSLPTELRHIPGMNRSRLENLTRDAARQGGGLEAVLSFSERQQLAEVRSRIANGVAGLRDAEAAALPVPPSILELEAGMQLGPDE